MRVLIICAGDATRWGNYLGVPKHLAPLCSEPILHRTVRLARQIAPEADIRVIVRDLTDPRYRIPGSRRAVARLEPARLGADKFLSSRHLWHTRERTIFLYGDVFFTRAALTAILTDPGPLDDDGWRFYARFTASRITGGRWAEIFAVAIEPHAHPVFTEALDAVVALGGRAGGWETYNQLTGGDPTRMWVVDRGHSVVIDDWTEDLDFPSDWDMWCWRYAHATPEQRAGAAG